MFELPQEKGLGTMLQKKKEREDQKAREQVKAAERLALKAELLREIKNETKVTIVEFEGHEMSTEEPLTLINCENYTLAVNEDGKYTYVIHREGTYHFDYKLSTGDLCSMQLPA